MVLKVRKIITEVRNSCMFKVRDPVGLISRAIKASSLTLVCSPEQQTRPARPGQLGLRSALWCVKPQTGGLGVGPLLIEKTGLTNSF